MSHFITIRTDLREREHLLAALRDLGHVPEEGEGLTVSGDSQKTETAEILVRTGCGFDVGLRRAGEGYEVVADWYRVEQLTSLRRQAFIRELTRRYAYRVICAQAKEQNLIVEEERVENGDIVIVLSERG